MADSSSRAYLALHHLKEELNRNLNKFLKEPNPFAQMQQVLGLKSNLQPSIYFSLVTEINKLKVELGFLTTFLDYTHKWTDAHKVVQNLVYLGIKIEADIAYVAEVLQNARAKYYVTENPLKLIDVASNLRGKIGLLKSEISDLCYSLSSHSLQSVSPLHNYYGWKYFLKDLSNNLKVLSMDASYARPLTEQMRIINDHLSGFLSFLDQVCCHPPSILPADSEVENALIYVGDVAIHTAHLSCAYWFGKMDANFDKEIIFMISDLVQKIDFCNTEFIELILGFLQALRVTDDVRSENFANFFMLYLLGGINQHILHEHLKFLVEIVINHADSREDVQGVVADIKQVIRDVGFFRQLLQSGMETRFMLFKLLATIWLIRAEVFLVEQLNDGEIFASSSNIGVLTTRLSFLMICFQHLPSEENTENAKQMLTTVEAVDRRVTSLYSSFQAKEIQESEVNDVLLKLLLKIVLFKSESFLTVLLNEDSNVMVLVKDRINALHEEMKFFTTLVTDKTDEHMEKGKVILTLIVRVGKLVISLYYSIHEKDLTEEIITKVNVLLSNLFDIIKSVKAKLKEIYLEVLRGKFPKTNELGFIDFLLRKMRETLNYSPDSIMSVRHQIQTILTDLEFFRSFLGDVLEEEVEHQELKYLGKCVIDVAYVAEYLIDLIVVGKGGSWYGLSQLYHLMEDIKLLKIQVSEIYEKNGCNVRVQNVAQHSKHIISQATTPKIDEVVMDLNDQADVIVDRLTRGTLQRDIVAIVGMPGIGKTTMAKKVYNDPNVTFHFHVRAWCCVSQVYRKRDLMLDILSNIIGLTSNILQMDDEDLDLELYQQLKQKRFLIVMDDMWNTGAWDDLVSSFPNDGNGSRILLTSRLHDVALKVKPDSMPHPLRLLSDDESWNLLLRKTFHNNCCPQELLDIGKQIAKTCKGLPLAIVAIAGLLERKDKTQDWWKQIEKSLSSHIVDDPLVQCMDILELSYNHLPNHLKACFLYFGAFMGDKDIPTRQLTRLWIAEGFIQETDIKSLEDLAENYLNDLIGRSLVMVSKRKSKGGVKSCHVHDMLRDLCRSKSKEENFLQLITGDDELHSSSDGLDYGIGFDLPSSSLTCENRRLCICMKRNHFVMSRPSGTHVRSLLFFAITDMYPRCPYDISFVCHNFKLLRVLDLESINMGSSFVSGIELLVQLRYLAISGDIDVIPSSISNLWNLETFVLKGLKGKVAFPHTIWCMERLRHLHVTSYASFVGQGKEVGKLYQLKNLVTLSFLHLSYGHEEDVVIIRRFPNLRKLKFILSQSQDCSENNNSFPALEHLSQLDSLKISYYGRAPNFSEFNLPLNLKKLTLSNFRLPWNYISMIGRLPNLEALKLLYRAFEGNTWEMKEGEFLMLKFLKLDTLDIVQWNASSDHFPNLEKLVLRRCKQLQEVPPTFIEISTLEVIEVHSCGQCVNELIARIEEEGIEGLRVSVNRSDSGLI